MQMILDPRNGNTFVAHDPDDDSGGFFCECAYCCPLNDMLDTFIRFGYGMEMN